MINQSKDKILIDLKNPKVIVSKVLNNTIYLIFRSNNNIVLHQIYVFDSIGHKLKYHVLKHKINFSDIYKMLDPTDTELDIVKIKQEIFIVLNNKGRVNIFDFVHKGV